MRRVFLSSLAATGISATLVDTSARTTTHKVDKRLLGTWKSDKDRTTKLWRYSKPIEDEKREKFENIFGKLTLHITETHVYGQFEDQKFEDEYTVFASDGQSVVVSHRNGGKAELKQYFFEESYMYVLSGYNVEFFKRVAA